MITNDEFYQDLTWIVQFQNLFLLPRLHLKPELLHFQTQSHNDLLLSVVVYIKLYTTGCIIVTKDG